LQAYPNPFNYSTTISYKTTVTGKVAITIYNLSGQEIRTLVSETRQADHHSVVWDGTNAMGGSAGSGVYFYTLDIDNRPVATKKLVLLR
jgi:flagellar hook assembly protein FlgD